MEKSPKFTLLSFKNQDPYLARLESCEDMLIEYTENVDDREAEMALMNLQQTIHWWATAFPQEQDASLDSQQPSEEDQESP